MSFSDYLKGLVDICNQCSFFSDMRRMDHPLATVLHQIWHPSLWYRSGRQLWRREDPRDLALQHQVLHQSIPSFEGVDDLCSRHQFAAVAVSLAAELQLNVGVSYPIQEPTAGKKKQKKSKKKNQREIRAGIWDKFLQFCNRDEIANMVPSWFWSTVCR